MDDERVEVEQCDRDAAAPIFAAYQAQNYADICKKGKPWADGLLIVQTLAKHRLAAMPDLTSITAKRDALRDALEQLLSSCTGVPVGESDGDTCLVGGPSRKALDIARAALKA